MPPPKVTLATRVDAIHKALDPIAAGRRTTTALETKDGLRIFGAGGRDLTPAQRVLLTNGKVTARLPGAYSKLTVLEHAAGSGHLPYRISISRTICPTCVAHIEQSGGHLTNPNTAEW